MATAMSWSSAYGKEYLGRSIHIVGSQQSVSTREINFGQIDKPAS